MSQTNRAIGVHHHGEPDCLVDEVIALPLPGPGQVVVRTTSLGINPADAFFRSTPWEQIAESFPKNLPPAGALRVIGADFAGVVETVGPEVQGWSVGDEVFASAPAMAAAGASSEYLAIDARLLAPLPSSLTAERAVAWPMVGITAWESLFDILRISPDGADRAASLLIIGATGGVGSAAIQLATAVAGLRVTATAGSDSGADSCLSLGAERVVSHREPLTTQLPGEQFDFILCCASAASYIDVMAELIAPFGHICAVVADLDPVPFADLRLRSASFGVEFMGLRSMGPQIERQGAILTGISQLIDQGVLSDISTERRSPINAATLAQAHRFMENGSTGKVTVSGWPQSG